VTLFAGALALSGIPPLAGFWSKDEILGSVWQDGKYVFWVVGLITAFVTAFYTFRLIYLTFWGKPRMDAKTAKHVHESPWSMVLPLVVLALGSLSVGFLSVPGQWGLIQGFLAPVFASADHVLGVEEQSLGAVGIALIAISVLVAALGIVLAWVMYVKRTDLPGLVGARLKRTYRTVHSKFYVDEFYGATFVRAAVDGSRWVWHKFDELVIDGAVNGTAWLWQRAGTAARPLQTGRVQNYLLAMFIGLFIIVTVVVFL
jgi:NADH-quinone oxidoreductase subunit L